MKKCVFFYGKHNVNNLFDSTPSKLNLHAQWIELKKELYKLGIDLIPKELFDKKTGKVHIKVDPVYFRPTDVNELRGDSTKARRELKWKPKTSFNKLVSEMMEADLNEIN